MLNRARNLRRDSGIGMRSMLGLMVLISAGSFLPGLHGADPAASDYIRRMEDRLRGTTSRSRMSIRIERPRFTRTLILDSWSDRRRDRSFIRILRPRKDRGVAFLKIKHRLWQYIPRIGREIRIEGSLLHDSWMGSDFTNDDLVRASSTEKDYTHSFLASDSPEKKRILLTPKPAAPVTWNKIIVEVRARDAMPLRQEFYDHRNRLKKVMEFTDIRSMGGRVIPTVFTMHSYRGGKSRSTTVMRFLRVRFNVRISGRVFSRANLRR